MSDWLSMEQKVSRTKAEAKALAEQYMEWQPPQRRPRWNPFAWLAILFHRRPKQQDKPQPARMKFG